MALNLITAATIPALTTAEAKAHLRVDHSADDAKIDRIVGQATRAAEQALGGRALLTQTWELSLDAFPPACELTRTPVASVTSVKYVDAAGTLQTLASNLYTLDAADQYGPAFVVPAYGTEWPTARDQVNAVVVRYVAGFTAASQIPPDVMGWIELMVGAMYEHRSLASAQQMHSLGFADRLLDGFRLWNC
jgi:uncharacterized phiE125 gp8 family phage protein